DYYCMIWHNFAVLF
nr:immunoglobulin light chain junction region [Macaca mulatta]